MELYEELPGGAGPMEEELYEDLPGSAYADAYPYPSPSPTSIAPPPLPSGPIPQRNQSDAPPPLPSGPIPQRNRPPSMSATSPPPPPMRAPSTSISSNTLPLFKKEMTKQQKAATMKPKVTPKSGGGGGGGIDMNEILKKARSRSDRAFEDLENKKTQKDGDDDKHAAPWLNQLRKTAPAPASKPKSSEAAPPPWVRKAVPAAKSEQEEDVPEFVKKARNIIKQGSGSDESTSPSPSPVPHRPAVKPRVASPPQQEPEEEKDKPPWMKQRDRQYQLARMGGQDSESKPAPAPRPGVAPPITSPKPGQNGSQHPPPPAKRSRPVPLPRKASSPTLLEVNEIQKAVSTPGSVRERAMTLEKHLSCSEEPPENTPRDPPKPGPYKSVPAAEPTQAPPPLPQEKQPPPIPRHIQNEVTSLIPPRGDRAPPRPAITSPSPAVPQRDMAPPSSKPPPPITAPPPSVPQRDMPPVSSKPPPPITSPPPSLPQRNKTHSGSKLHPPLSFSPPAEPPPPVPTSRGEPTPPMVSLRYRRRPLQSVDPYNPPPIPSRSTKPRIPVSITDGTDGTDEIYDDTLGAIGGELPPTAATVNGYREDEGPDELYDDVFSAQGQKPPLPNMPPPPSRPPPSFNQPHLPAKPPPFRPPPISVEDEEQPSYEMDDTEPHGGSLSSPPTIDQEQEVYEDINPGVDEFPPSNVPSSAPSISSLVPPSPSHAEASPTASPTLGRKGKLSKDEKKAQKEEERREKERKRQERELEKEKKKRDEVRLKNKIKCLRAYKQFGLPNDVQPLFAVEVLLDHPRTKDHINVITGEVAHVLLLNHPKLPDGKYLIEKDDGSIGYVQKNITQRTAYQSTQSIVQGEQLESSAAILPELIEPEDIYERLPQEEEDLSGGFPAPGGYRYPVPSQAPPPPPPADGPEEMYEYLDEIEPS